MSPKDQKLDLASTIEAKDSAWTVEGLQTCLRLVPNPQQDGQFGSQSCDPAWRHAPVRSCAHGTMAESQNHWRRMEREESSMNE